MIAAGMAGDPEVFDFSGASRKISGGQDVEPAARDTKLISGLDGRQGTSIETIEHIADKCRCQPVAELLVVFRARRIPGRPAPAASLFVGHRYARPPQRLAAGAAVVLLC